MAKLDALPDPEVIRQFRGVIDFYIWRGIPVARAWPKKPSQLTPATIQAATVFKEISRLLQNTWGPMHDYCHRIGEPYGWTWKDVMTRAAFGNLQFPKFLHEPVQPAILLDAQFYESGPSQHTLELRFDRPVHVGGGFYDRGRVLTPRYITYRGVPRRLGFSIHWDQNINFNQFPPGPSTVALRPASDAIWRDFPGIVIHYGDQPIYPGSNFFGSLPPFELGDLGFPTP